MSQSPKNPVFSLSSTVSIVTLAGMVATGFFFLAPLKTLPDDMKGVRMDMIEVQRTQAVQTEALKTLAEVAKEGRDTRRDLDKSYAEVSAAIRRHDYQLESVNKKLEKLDGN